MNTAYIGLGGNIGNSADILRRAARAIARLPSVRLCAVSPLYLSDPVGCVGNAGHFHNAVIRLQTALSPARLWRRLRAIERREQKRRRQKNMPRRLDIDLLLYNNARLVSRQLTVPHPKMMQRVFVLQPLSDIMPAADSRRPRLLAARRRCAGQRLTRLP